jgi:hypothetical protein
MCYYSCPLPTLDGPTVHSSSTLRRVYLLETGGDAGGLARLRPTSSSLDSTYGGATSCIWYVVCYVYTATGAYYARTVSPSALISECARHNTA